MSFTDNYMKLRQQRQESDNKSTGSTTKPVLLPIGAEDSPAANFARSVLEGKVSPARVSPLPMSAAQAPVTLPILEKLPSFSRTILDGTVNPALVLQTNQAKNSAAQNSGTTQHTEAQPGDFSGGRTYAGGGRQEEFSPLKLVGGTLLKGADEFVSGLTSTAAWLENATLGKLFPGTTENSFIQWLNDVVQGDKEYNQDRFAGNVEAGGKAAEIVDKYGTATAAAVPQAALALMTAGGSTAVQGTTAGLEATASAAQAGTGVLNALKSSVSAMSKDPQYWLSFSQVAGNSYDQAKADGADDTKASLYALGNGLMNAAVEVGGGLQALPGELQQGKAWYKAWLEGMLDEGKEEVVQGILERGFQNLIYQKENPLVSVSDGNAVLNLKTAAEEFTGGAVVGGILGGAQTAIGSVGKGVFLPGSGLDTPVQTQQTTQSDATAPARPVTTQSAVNQTQDTTAGIAVSEGAEAQKNTAPSVETVLPKMTMADFTDVNSPVWNNVDYNDTETQSAIMRTTHQEMVNAGDVVQIPSGTIKQVEQSYPDLRAMKKSERTPMLRQKINELKTSLRQFLNELKGGSYEFEVNGNILEAKLYDTGIREVMEKITQDKASMLYHSDQVFQNARYLYSTPDYDGDPNIYRWNYFYTPVQIGEETVGVRIAVRDMVEGTNNLPESQIYNWGIKTDATLGGGRPGVSTPSSGASSVAPSDPSIRQSVQGVNTQSAQAGPESFGDNSVNGFGQNTVGAAQARFKYQEAPTQSVGDNLFTEQEMQEHPELQNKHRVMTDAEGNYIAEEMLVNEYEDEVERLKTDEWGKVENIEGHMILEDLVEKARESGSAEDWSKVTEWKKLYDQKGGTEHGQALQGRAQFANSPADITAEAVETLDGKNIRKMSDEKKNKILNDVHTQAAAFDALEEGDTASLISLIERNNEIRRTTGLFAKKTAKQMDWALNEVVKSYPETAESFLRDVALSQIRSIASDYQKISPLEAVKNYRIMGMLSKASTVMRNLVSNNVFDPLESLSNNVGIIVDGLMSKATGSRTTAVDKSWFSKAKRSGSLEGMLKSYIQVGLDADVDGATSRYETSGGRTFKMTGNFLERLLSTWSKYESYTLNTTDEFQKGGIQAETQRGIDKLKSKGKLGAEALPDWAGETAKQRTFQNDGAIANAMVGARSAMNNLSIKDSRGGSLGVGDVMLPFARVPGNLVAQAANYSPLGLVNSLREMTGVLIDAKKGNVSLEKQAQAARDFGRGVTGSALLAGFAALAAKGLIDVAGADDKDKEALEKAQGRTGTQWNLSATMRAFKGESTEWQDGDILMSIGFLDPINAIMAAGALLSDAYSEDGKLTAKETADASFSSLVQAVLDLPAMSSISSLIDAYTYAEGETTGEKAANAAMEYAGSQASSFLLPNALKGIATGTDDTVRNQYAGETWQEDAVNSIKAGIPGLRETLPASLDSFGREKTYTGNNALNILNANLLPGALTKYSETELEGKMEDLYGLTGVTGIYPNKSAPSSVTVDKKAVSLSPEEKETYQRISGQTAEDIMVEMMKSGAFQNATESEQAAYLELANKYARAVAAEEVTDGEYASDKYVKLAQAARKELGLSEAEYLMLYQDYGGTAVNGDKVREAYQAGMDPVDYLEYYAGKKSYDTDGSGGYTIAENAEAIKSSGLSESQQEIMWLLTYPDWAEAAEKKGVSTSEYIQYKVATYGCTKDADKRAALVAAGFSMAEARTLVNKIG